MKLDRVYECVDGRPGGRLTGITMLRVFKGVVQPASYMDGPHETILVDDNLEDDDENGNVTLHLDSGKVYFVNLTLLDFQNRLGPEMFHTPEFKDDEELQDWFRVRIRGSLDP
jgi:hypothetical protein